MVRGVVHYPSQDTNLSEYLPSYSWGMVLQNDSFWEQDHFIQELCEAGGETLKFTPNYYTSLIEQDLIFLH